VNPAFLGKISYARSVLSGPLDQVDVYKDHSFMPASELNDFGEIKNRSAQDKDDPHMPQFSDLEISDLSERSNDRESFQDSQEIHHQPSAEHLFSTVDSAFLIHITIHEIRKCPSDFLNAF
jgi:hypothetical protein